MRPFLIPILLLIFALPCRGAEPHEPVPVDSADFLSTDSIASIRPVRLAIVGGLTVAGFVVGHVLLTDLWWKGEPSRFHFNWHDDWRYALGADKVGHAVTPYIGTDIYRQGLEWTGMSRRVSLWWAGGLASAYTTYVEIRDGFSAEWGFSWGDFAANHIGIGWRVAEEYEPWLTNIRFKISYWPSRAFRSGGYGSIVDDYESTYHWGSLNVDALLPDAWRNWWPDFVNIAVGHSVKGIAAYDGSGEHELYLSLDWNTEGLPGDGTFWNWLKRTLNYYHLPAPAVRILPDVVWYGVHF